MNLLIIIPAYNEAENIERVVNNLIENYPQYDYVLVNDGSSDDTRKICAKKGYNFLDLPINVGLAGAIRAGIRYANYHGYDYAVQIDGDGQHDPKYIKDMLEKMREIIAEQLNCDGETIGLDTSFKDDLGADSLDLFELVMALEEEYGLEIPAEELSDVETVGDIIEYLKNKGVED